MDNTVLYSVNIAMESIMVLILSLLFIACFLQKKRFLTTTALTYMTGAMLLLLVEQIVVWALMLHGFSFAKLRIAYIFDYLFAYSLVTAFYYYMEAFIKDGYQLLGSDYERNKKFGYGVVIWGVFSTVLYAVSLFDPNLYRVYAGEELYSVVAYILMHVMVLVPVFFALYVFIKHRRIANRSQGFLLITSLIIFSLLSVVDELLLVCVSSVIISLFIFVLYLGIDLARGLIIDRQEKNLVDLQTKIMLSQMQPHFLYNVFTTISGMCEMQKAYEARDVVNHFADYFRVNLDSLGKDKFIPFEKELEHIKTYLWLEKIRFEDYLNVRYEISVTDFMVPSLAIQPIVENAVKHGIHPKEEPGTLTIKTYEDSTAFVIVIEDDGVGFNVDELPTDGRMHVGIQNVKTRLNILCEATLDIQSQKGKGTQATIRIPKKEA